MGDEKTLADKMRDMAEWWGHTTTTVSAYTAATLARKWADEHMDLRELDAIADAMDGGDE